MCVLSDEDWCGGGAELRGCAPPPPDRNLNTDVVDTMILNTLGDSPFNRNQPMKSDDQAEE